MGHPLHRRFGQHRSQERQFAPARLPVLAGHVQDGAIELGDPPGRGVDLFAVGQVAVLVQDAGQLANLVVKGPALEPLPGPLLALPAPAHESLGHEGRVGLLNEAEQLVGQLPVALREQALGGRGQAIPPAGPPRTGSFVPVGQQTLLAERAQLLAHRAHGDAQRRRRAARPWPHPWSSRRSAPPYGPGPWPTWRPADRPIPKGPAPPARTAGRPRVSAAGGVHGRIRWLSPNSCHRYPQSQRLGVGGRHQFRSRPPPPAGTGATRPARANRLSGRPRTGYHGRRRSPARSSPRRGGPHRARRRRSPAPVTAVVPTAMTRWPSSWAALTCRAVTAGTRNHSGAGGSWLSGDDTPQWRTKGATVTPLRDQPGRDLRH